MDTVVLGLSVAIAAVVILLLSCWDTKKAPKKSGSASVVQSVEAKAETPKSTWGTGLQNRQSNDRYKDLANLAGYDDYNSVAQYMSIEPEVYESHSRYADDMGRSTSGASMLPVRDDPQDVVPWVGLRKPRYHEVYSGAGARQEHSEIPDQMRSSTSYCLA